MADHVIYYSQALGLTDSSGRKLNDSQIPRIRPGELKTFELNMLDYAFSEGDICHVGGDTDCKDATPLKIVGTSMDISAPSKAIFTLGSTQAYADLWNSINNPSGILVLWIQLQVTKLDGRIHRLVFQLRGAPAVGGDADQLAEPDYVTSDQLAQGVSSGVSTHNQDETAHPDIRELIAAASGGVSLATTAPADLAAQAAVGTGTTAARDDHQHKIPSAADVGASALNHNHDSVYSGISHTHTGFVATSAIGTAGGVCELNESGLVPAIRLPSYVDDVVEAANYAALPATGEAGKIYIALDTGYQYRWGGSAYVELPRGGVALGETSETAYRGDRGKTAYDHSQATGNPHGLTLSGLGAAAVAHTHSEYVAGPASSTDNALFRYDGTGGKTAQSSNVIVDDLGNISISGTDTSGTDGLLMNPSAKTSGNFIKAQINSGSTLFSVDYSGKVSCTSAVASTSGSFYGANTSGVTTISSWNAASCTAGSTGVVFVRVGDGTNGTNIRTGGTNKWLDVEARYNQASGTAENYDLWVNRTEVAVGSGGQYSQGWAVGGTIHSSLSKLGLLTLGVGVDKQIDQRTGTGRKLWTGTQAEYDALGTWPTDNNYLIHEA